MKPFKKPRMKFVIQEGNKPPVYTGDPDIDDLIKRAYDNGQRGMLWKPPSYLQVRTKGE